MSERNIRLLEIKRRRIEALEEELQRQKKIVAIMAERIAGLEQRLLEVSV